VRQYDTKRLLLPSYCIPCFYAFYTLHCKTLRLSVFNNELLDLKGVVTQDGAILMLVIQVFYTVDMCRIFDRNRKRIFERNFDRMFGRTQ